MLKASNLTIEYAKPIFRNLSFTLGNKEKVGLIGLNGTGKSTLLKIISGFEQPDSGSVEFINEKVAYLPQEYDFDDGVLVGELLEELVEDPKNEIYKVNRVLDKLKFRDVYWYQEVNTLSYGQKMKLYLVRLLMEDPTILLLDEPTNHLDIYGIMWLEEFIKDFDGICIMVSHDRAFLNACVNKVFEIDEMGLNIFEGNYDDYIEQKEDLIEKRKTEFTLQERRRKKFEDMIVRIKKGPGGEKQARALSAARSRMEREVLRNEKDKYKEQKIHGLSLEGETHNSKLVLRIKNLKFGYTPENLLFQNSELEIYGKEKVLVYGSNGIGKSTLIKLIIGELSPIDGTIRIGDNLTWTYFSQDQSHLPMEQTVEEYFMTNTGVTFSQSFGILEKFLFTKDMRKIKIKKLSPGQRARLSIAVFAQHKYDFMILDEPTNHLDIKSKEIIEESLREFKGSLLLISHDRYFIENVGVDRSVTIEDGEIRELF